MEIEELVAPLELCKLIPKGEFEDSALVWCQMYQGEKHRLLRRDSLVNDTKAIPAPLLEEIMAKLRQDYVKAGAFIRSYWGCYIIDNYGDEIAEVDDNSPTNAALKLWLKLKGIENDTQC